MFPLVLHQPASPSICPAVQSLRRGLSTNPGVTMWCVCGSSWRDDVCRVCECSRGSIVVMDVIWRRLCVNIIWGRVIYLLWVGQGWDEWGGEVSFQSCWCVVEVCAIFCYCLLWLETIDVCIWRMFVFMSVVWIVSTMAATQQTFTQTPTQSLKQT